MNAIAARANAATEGQWEVVARYHIQGASHCACRPNYGPLVWEGRRDINGHVMQTHIHRRSRPLGDDDTTVYGGALPEPVVVALSTDEYVRISAEDAEFIAHARTDVPALVAALRTVLDVHEAVETCYPDWDARACAECSDPENGTTVLYPCSTVRAIEDALGDR